MIHVDVKRDGKGPHADYVVETSIDGAPWTEQYRIPATVGTPSMDDAWREREAEMIARMLIAGIRLAGVEARGTAHGYAL